MDRSEYSVGIGFPCGPDVPWQTTMALARTAHMLASLEVPCNIHAVAGSSDVTIARSVVLENFLAGSEKFLFWIDSDIVWRPEDFIRLLRLAKQLGLVSAAYPLKRDPSDCIINFAEAGPTPNDFGCFEVTGLGLGFTCVRRDLVDAFAATKQKMYHAGNKRTIIDAFRRDVRVDEQGVRHARGEDGAFFDDMRQLGFKAWLDPTIQLGHVGSKEYRADLTETLWRQPTSESMKVSP
jgi:hypothetical protein